MTLLSPAGRSALAAAGRPALSAAIDAEYGTVADIVGRDLLDLCRERVLATLAGAGPADDGGLTDLERACLAFTEQFCHSAPGVTDEQVAALSVHLDPGRVFALAVGVSVVERGERMSGLLAILEATE